MKTLYIDVYFLINFSVDLLALYFSAKLIKIGTSALRLIISAIIGGLYAIFVTLYINNVFTSIIVSLPVLILTTVISTGKASLIRKFKYLVSYLLFEILIGGTVYYLYGFFDRILPNFTYGEENTDSGMIVMSVIVLMTLLFLKLVLKLFSSGFSEKSVRVLFSIDGKGYELDALVDSGNLLTDPIGGSPVMLITKKEGDRIFGKGSDDYRKIEPKYQKRLRLIPKNDSLLIGYKPDNSYIMLKNTKEKIIITVAIDAKGDTYGGYGALIPLSAVNSI